MRIKQSTNLEVIVKIVIVLNLVFRVLSILNGWALVVEWQLTSEVALRSV